MMSSRHDTAETKNLPPDTVDSRRPVLETLAPKSLGKRSCLLIAGLTVLLLAGTTAVFFLLLVPWFQPPVDPNLVAIKIEKRPDTGSGNLDSSGIRGSVTDQLFQVESLPPEHPLDPVLAVAELGLERIRSDVRDYTALMVKQERVGDKLLDEELMRIKVRHGQAGQSPPVPKSFYLLFEKPRSMTGREVIWVEGRNENKLVAHEGGLLNVIRANLNPTGLLAMRGNRYPITELGIETLVMRMLEKGQRDRQYDECTVDIDRDMEVDGHKCTVVTITHPHPRAHFEFFQAKIYIDDEIDLPIGYEGFIWPDDDSAGEPVLLERYFYRDLKINVGLTDLDFDPDNPDYSFP